MANTKISALAADATPTRDDLLATVNDPGGTPATKKATIANVIRAGSVDDVQACVFAQDAGANDTYTATLSPAPTAYVTGNHYRFKANTANTGPCTINFNALGAKSIKKVAGGITTDLADNDIRAGQWVDLVYDGTNMQMQSLLGNAPSSGATTLDGLTDVVITSPSTDEVLKYNGSEWVNSTVPAGGGTFAGGGFEQFRVMAFNKNPGSGTTTTAIGISAITPFADSATADDDADGPFVRWNTAATTNERAGTEWNNTNLVQTSWLPQIFIKMKTHTSISVCRIWVGVFSAEPIVDDPTSHGLGFRYSTAAPDTNWQAWSNDGTGGGTITDTGVAVATSTDYMFAIKVVSTSSVEFYISTDLGVSYTLVATHTTNLPTSTQGMNYWFKIITLENVAKSIKASYTYIRMR